MATNALYQSIELLSQEKGIDPAIVVGAVEEAIALAKPVPFNLPASFANP